MQTVQSSVKASRSSRGFMRDLMRDWRRWTKAERVAASCLVAIIFLGASLFIISTIALNPV
ncbi:MAG TPA: hypothetical protein VKZ79_15780 [Alphaproteobacteria bacterium]|nr:hypothetical protein [Alphaproteobacteria bacterium]